MRSSIPSLSAFVSLLIALAVPLAGEIAVVKPESAGFSTERLQRISQSVQRDIDAGEIAGAITVVHCDPWWNPAAEAQATDRAHRIGQTRAVTSYKLIAAGTVEEKVLALQTEKRALLADVFGASDDAAAKLSLADLKSLLA
jgi:hypothetical protein